jgi:thiamine-phosphate pyrophosphorylase
MKENLDFSLYLVTDRSFTEDRSLPDVVACAVRGGATMVQLREKRAAAREIFDLALSLRKVLGPLEIPLIINDRLDIAMAAGCEGVHLGPRDMPPSAARRVMGPERLLGVSVHTPEDARGAEEAGADYVSVSPVFYTATKAKIRTPVGLEGVRAVCEAVQIPVIGIGGINASNVAGLIRAGARGGAVVSAVMADSDPEAAARRLFSAVKKTRTGR